MEMQELLDLPQIDRKATRQILRKVFTAYRQYKVILDMLDTDENAVFVPARTSSDAMEGYAEAADPKLLRAPYSVSSGTEKAAFKPSSDPQESKMRYLCYQVEKKVWRLPVYQREIVLRRYMATKSPHPTHEQVWEELYNEGWYVGLRYYTEQETEAMYKLACGMRIEQLLEVKDSD